MIDKATRKASHGNTGGSFSPEPGPEGARPLSPGGAPLTVRQELAARFVEATLKSGNLTFNNSTEYRKAIVIASLGLADAILADGKEE